MKYGASSIHNKRRRAVMRIGSRPLAPTNQKIVYLVKKNRTYPKVSRLARVIYKAQKDAFKSITPPSKLDKSIDIEFDDKNCIVRLKLRKKNKKST